MTEIGDKGIFRTVNGKPVFVPARRPAVGEKCLLYPIAGDYVAIPLDLPVVGETCLLEPVNGDYVAVSFVGNLWFWDQTFPIDIYCSVTGKTYHAGVDSEMYRKTVSGGFYYTYFDLDWEANHPTSGDPIPDVKIVRIANTTTIDIYIVYTGWGFPTNRDMLYYDGSFVGGNPGGGGAMLMARVDYETNEILWHR